MAQAAVGFHRARSRGGRQHLLERALEGHGEARQLGFGDGEARGLRMATEARDQARNTLRDEIEAVAQVQPRHRAARALERTAVRRARKAHHRAVHAVLEPVEGSALRIVAEYRLCVRCFAKRQAPAMPRQEHVALALRFVEFLFEFHERSFQRLDLRPLVIHLLAKALRQPLRSLKAVQRRARQVVF